MIETLPTLFIGTVDEIPNLLREPFDWRLVNVSQTLHYAMHNWKTYKDAQQSAFCYIYHQDPLCVSINWVDAEEAKYFNYQDSGVRNVRNILNQISLWLKDNKKVIITCNQGISRSPSIAMLYLAFVSKSIPNTTHEEAKAEFLKWYPTYQPSKGMQEFLIEQWEHFNYNYE